MVEVRIDDDPLALDTTDGWPSRCANTSTSCSSTASTSPSPFQSETDYLAQALSPAATSAGSPSTVRTEVVAESQLSRRDLTPYDAVVLCNVAQFTEAEVTALEDYLRQGGGVVVFGGGQVSADNYNRLLHAEGKGLLPAAVGPTVGDASKKRSVLRLQSPGLPAPDRRRLRRRVGLGPGGPDQLEDLAVPQAEAPREGARRGWPWPSTTATRP
jgi:hypothetical protein